ncbi:MAG: hypothetical protein P4L56_28135 [Candidatus Sulfopaludibacter sp.]|nr:hypothetical protein [Candidatus Sulfopaludibacter sp.]
MIAAVKRWHAILSALLFFIASAARASEDLNGAARELARKTAGFGNRGEPVSVAWRNLSSLGSAELAQARAAFEAALQEAGGRLNSIAPVGVRITLSETPAQYVLVEEAQNGDDRRVWIAAWKRAGPARVTAPGVSLDRKLVWEQEEQILDVAFPGTAMLVLTPTQVTLYARPNGAWEARQSQALPAGKAWPRDLRGHLRMTGSGFQAFLPGVVCSGSVEPSLTLACQGSEEPWVLESGSHAILLANFAAARNYFDGRVVSQTGQPKPLGPFYSAAAVEEQGRTVWLAAMLDGHIQMFNSALDPAGSLAGWGSDIAGTSARCGGGAQVLATRPGDSGDPDSIQAFAIVERAAAPLGNPVAMTGPVSALWPSGPTAVLAVVHDPASGKYAAYVLTVVCGE